MFLLEVLQLLVVVVHVVVPATAQPGLVGKQRFCLVHTWSDALRAGHVLQVHQRGRGQALRLGLLDVADAEGADGSLPPLRAGEPEGGDDVTRSSKLRLV